MADCLFTAAQVSTLISQVNEIYNFLFVDEYAVGTGYTYPQFIAHYLDDILRVGLVDIDDRLHDVDSKVDTVDSNVDDIKSSVNNTTYGLSAIKTRGNDIYSEICNTTWGLEAIKQAIGYNETLISDTKTITNNIYTDTHITIPGLISDLQKSVDDLDFTGLEDKIDIIDGLLDSYLINVYSNVGNIYNIVSSSSYGNESIKDLVTSVKDTVQHDTWGCQKIMSGVDDVKNILNGWVATVPVPGVLTTIAAGVVLAVSSADAAAVSAGVASLAAGTAATAAGTAATAAGTAATEAAAAATAANAANAQCTTIIGDLGTINQNLITHMFDTTAPANPNSLWAKIFAAALVLADILNLLQDANHGLEAISDAVGDVGDGVVNQLFESTGFDYYAAKNADGVYVLKGLDNIKTLIKVESGIPDYNKMFRAPTETAGEYIYLTELINQYTCGWYYYYTR